MSLPVALGAEAPRPARRKHGQELPQTRPPEKVPPHPASRLYASPPRPSEGLLILDWLIQRAGVCVLPEAGRGEDYCSEIIGYGEAEAVMRTVSAVHSKRTACCENRDRQERGRDCPVRPGRLTAGRS